jgi:hypothetical protein
VPVDINDLTLLGGFSIGFLLLWLQFSLWREVDTLGVAFGNGQTPQQLAAVYQQLSSFQVFMIPPSKAHRKPRFESRLPTILVWAPVVVLFGALLNDILTLQLGLALRPKATIAAIAVGVGLLFWSGKMSLGCHKSAGDMDQGWKRAFYRAYVMEEEIRQRAYELYERRGKEAGHEREDWLQAESQIKAEGEIRHRAYELYELRGRKAGHDREDWVRAENEIRKWRSRVGKD